MDALRKIEISFPCDVELPNPLYREMFEWLEKVCRHYETTHPGRVMWPFGFGSKIVGGSIYFDGPMQFDDSTLSVECAEREDYDHA